MMLRSTPRKKNVSQRSTKKPRCFVLRNGGDRRRDSLGRGQTGVGPDRDSILEAVGQSSASSIWISPSSERTEELLRAITTFIASHRGIRTHFGRLLMLESPRPRLLPLLHGCFCAVVGEVPDFETLPMDQLAEVLAAPAEKARDVFVGGSVDRATGTLALVRGDFERLIVPLSIFRPSGRQSPDLRYFELDDFGQTLRFGEYEASADIVLWECDPDYRRRVNSKRRAEAKGFGASLRRLRKQRGLSQSDFPKVARKTISRIENGEIEKPHRTTLNRIASALGVQPDEIETY